MTHLDSMFQLCRKTVMDLHGLLLASVLSSTVLDIRKVARRSSSQPKYFSNKNTRNEKENRDQNLSKHFFYSFQCRLKIFESTEVFGHILYCKSQHFSTLPSVLKKYRFTSINISCSLYRTESGPRCSANSAV